MDKFLNYVLIAVIAIFVMSWFLGIWGILGRDIQLYCAFTGAVSLVYTMIRYRGWVYKFMTQK